MPKVAVVVLHYENEAMTNQCIDSIKEHTPFVDIIVVDNCSPQVFVREDVIVVRTKENRNVKGMNFGFTYALTKDYDYITNFDNDIICFNDWATPLVEEMEKDKTIGITGGKQWNEERTQFNSVGADLMGMVYRNTPTERTSVLWLQGSFHMLRASMMRLIGIHDERYETICSDCDYCLHARDRGYKVVFVPDSEVIHIGNATYAGVAVDSEQTDKTKFLHKWSGLNFCNLAKTFPYDTMYKDEIIIGYNLNGDKRTYPICLMPSRPSTLKAKEMFGDKKIKVVEVGSMYGNNASSILRNLNIELLDLIDNNTDGWMTTLIERFSADDRVYIIDGDSVEVAKDYKDGSLDFVYIDADHSYDAVKADIEAWLPKVKEGGLLAGHDYLKPEDEDKDNFNVIDAVNDVLGKDNITVFGIDWYIVNDKTL